MATAQSALLETLENTQTRSTPRHKSNSPSQIRHNGEIAAVPHFTNAELSIETASLQLSWSQNSMKYMVRFEISLEMSFHFISPP
mmetsp:Transcript_57869/g.126580  ORF Transcript_57869/g.126580 Transcript_57869/m.126580 type:complete len:85 (+) Transcript_57869:38-292(+)